MNINTDNIVTGNMEFSTNLLSNSANENPGNTALTALEFEVKYLQGFDRTLQNSNSKLPVTKSMSNKATKYLKYGKGLGILTNIIAIIGLFESFVYACQNSSGENWENFFGEFAGFFGGIAGALGGGTLVGSITGLLGLASGPGALVTGGAGIATGELVDHILLELFVKKSDKNC